MTTVGIDDYKHIRLHSKCGTTIGGMTLKKSHLAIHIWHIRHFLGCFPEHQPIVPQHPTPPDTFRIQENSQDTKLLLFLYQFNDFS